MAVRDVAGNRAKRMRRAVVGPAGEDGKTM
jgi:hypothetical protein